MRILGMMTGFRTATFMSSNIRFKFGDQYPCISEHLMSKQRVLTGITTTGTPHLGNYVGAIRPAIEASQNSEIDSFFFG